MSDFKHWSDPNEIAEALVSTADRRWLFNPRIDKASTDLKAKADDREQARRQRREAEINGLVDAVLKVKEIERGRNDKYEVPAEALTAGIEHIVGIVVSGDYIISAPRMTWQSWIVLKLLEFSDNVYFEWRLRDILSAMQRHGWMPPELDSDAMESYQSTIRLRLPEFQTAASVVETYMGQLVQRGVLATPYTGGGYRFASGWSKAVRSGRWQKNEDVKRETESVHEIFARCLENERGARMIWVEGQPGAEDLDISFDDWMGRPIAPWNLSPRNIIDSGTAEQKKELRKAMDGLSALVSRQRPVANALGLPLHSLQSQAEHEEKLREERRIERERAQRAESLLTYMQRHIGPRSTAAWSEAPHAKLEGRTPRECSRDSDEGLKLAEALADVDGPAIKREQELEELRQQRQREIDRKAAPYRDAFKQEAQKRARYGAVEWMDRPHFELRNQTPWRYVTDKDTYNIALKLMPGVKPRR